MPRPPAGGKALGSSRSDHTVVAKVVSVMKGAFQHIGERLEAAVWMIRKPGGSTHVEVIEQHERVQVPQLGGRKEALYSRPFAVDDRARAKLLQHHRQGAFPLFARRLIGTLFWIGLRLCLSLRRRRASKRGGDREGGHALHRPSSRDRPFLGCVPVHVAHGTTLASFWSQGRSELGAQTRSAGLTLPLAMLEHGRASD